MDFFALYKVGHHSLISAGSACDPTFESCWSGRPMIAGWSQSMLAIAMQASYSSSASVKSRKTGADLQPVGLQETQALHAKGSRIDMRTGNGYGINRWFWNCSAD